LFPAQHIVVPELFFVLKSFKRIHFNSKGTAVDAVIILLDIIDEIGSFPAHKCHPCAAEPREYEAR
jgi:hypothetical protein